MMLYKEQLVITCQQILQERVEQFNNGLSELRESAESESKSTAGDKHETGRAMMQLEQEKLGKQLQEAEAQLTEFEKINFTSDSDKIILGSLIETNRGLFLMATSIGKTNLEGKTIFVISPQSPLGKTLLGKKQKDTVVFNGVSYDILNIK